MKTTLEELSTLFSRCGKACFFRSFIMDSDPKLPFGLEVRADAEKKSDQANGLISIG